MSREMNGVRYSQGIEEFLVLVLVVGSTSIIKNMHLEHISDLVCQIRDTLVVALVILRSRKSLFKFFDLSIICLFPTRSNF